MSQEENNFFVKVHLELYQIWEDVGAKSMNSEPQKSLYFPIYEVGKTYAKRSEYRSCSFIKNLRCTLTSTPSLAVAMFHLRVGDG